MNKHLKELIDVAQLDKEIDLMEPKITQIRQGLINKENQKDKKDQEILELQDQEKDILTLIGKGNTTIQSLGEKLDEISKKMSEVKTEKELKALNIEEELSKEQLTFQNSEITRLEDTLKVVQGKIATLNSEIKELNTQINTIEQEVSSEVNEIKKAQEEIEKKKSVMVAKMDQKIVSFYEKIRKWAKNTSVVPVYKQACGGCFIKISDRVYSDILKGENITTCPHCGRILFNKED